MAWLTGAIRKEVTRHRTLMARHDGVCNHIAVSDGLSLFNYFNQPGNATSHFYVRKSGPQGSGAGMADFEQYVDTRYRAPANFEGNHRLVSIETQGGVGSDLNNGWTVAQVNRLAWIAAECNRLHGIPLQAMPNSLPTTRGIGYHRLGVDPYRVSAGELWSSSYGKVCPGSARIAQQPQIITLAKQYANGTTTEDWFSMATKEELAAVIDARLIAHADTGTALNNMVLRQTMKAFENASASNGVTAFQDLLKRKAGEAVAEQAGPAVHLQQIGRSGITTGVALERNLGLAAAIASAEQRSLGADAEQTALVRDLAVAVQGLGGTLAELSGKVDALAAAEAENHPKA